MTAKIIHEKPLSGEYAEVLFYENEGNSLWVLFEDDETGSEWLGIFGCGSSTKMSVELASAPGEFFVVAGGFGYVVDALNRRVINSWKDTWICDLAYDAKTRRIVATDGIRLSVIENQKRLWAGPRIAIDGVGGLCFKQGLLHGETSVNFANDYGHVYAPFTLDPITFEYRCSKRCLLGD